MTRKSLYMFSIDAIFFPRIFNLKLDKFTHRELGDIEGEDCTKSPSKAWGGSKWLLREAHSEVRWPPPLPLVEDWQ
jgi:hypothetical protein